MKFAAYGIFGTTLGFGAIDAVSGPVAVQYGALAILGWVVWYLLARAMPALMRAQEKEREAFLESQNATSHALSEVSRSVDRLTEATSEARRSAG